MQILTTQSVALVQKRLAFIAFFSHTRMILQSKTLCGLATNYMFCWFPMCTYCSVKYVTTEHEVQFMGWNYVPVNLVSADVK